MRIYAYDASFELISIPVPTPEHDASEYSRAAQGQGFFFDFYPVCRRFEASGSRSWRRRNIRTCPGLRGGMQCRAKPEAGGELSLYSLPV